MDPMSNCLTSKQKKDKPPENPPNVVEYLEGTKFDGTREVGHPDPWVG